MECVENSRSFVAARQGGGREIITATVKQKTLDLGTVTWGETREGSPHPRG
jgi:hypothetical protein